MVEELEENRKVIILYGPRQVGKTTLAKKVLIQLPYKMLEINADFDPIKDLIGSKDLQKIEGLISGIELLFIDEAQRIPDIGLTLKILHDQFPSLRILVTGSSSFELANLTQEALTGRSLTFNLFPIALKELSHLYSPFELIQRLDSFLIYGMYPEILSIANTQRKILYLRELVSSYLYKDLFELSNIKHPEKIVDLLRLLAFQLGSQVSQNELGKQLGMARETVGSYLDLLEKSFVIFKLRGYSRNPRKEISKMNKYFFFDLGVRNSLIENFNPMNLRADKGQLWENFLLVERMKTQAYSYTFANRYFWRTYSQQEIDYVEESGGELRGYEFKYTSRKEKIPPAWKKDYPEASFQTIHSDNFLSFLL
ncbi:MAG: ATP-binding protein [Bacteroidota bacterium]